MPQFPVRVAERKVLTQSVVALTLASVDGETLPPYEPGAHIDVETPGGHVRQYSLYESSDDQQRYKIAVLHEPESRGGSRSIWYDVEVGDLLKVGAPRNHFKLDPGTKRAILLAGGIGITPLMAMAQALCNAGVPFELHYATRSRAQCAFAAELQAKAFSSRVHLYHDDEDVRIDLARLLAAPEPGTHVYVCGPGGFIQAVLDAGRQAGFAADKMHREFFVATEQTDIADEPFEVEIRSTGEVLMVPADRTLSSVLIEHGLPLLMSCEQGVCGTCMTTVIAGIPDHRDSVLTDEDRIRGDTILPCCSRSRTSSPRLVLDL